MHAVSSLSRRRKPNIFKIGPESKVAVKFHLSKPVFKIGEDVVGWFDFSGTTASCYQVTVTLETVELIEEAHRPPTDKQKRAATATGETGTVTVHAKQALFCRHLTTSTVMLPVPLTATPQFSTGIVSVEWRLAFEFVLGGGDVDVPNQLTSEGITGGNEGDVINTGPTKVPVETIKWQLPISVLPTDPSHLPAINALLSTVF
jgi:hypothetical protein